MSSEWQRGRSVTISGFTLAFLHLQTGSFLGTAKYTRSFCTFIVPDN